MLARVVPYVGGAAMKILHRNKRKFHYALFDKRLIKDEYGNGGEYKVL